jgi:hypothetical protein
MPREAKAWHGLFERMSKLRPSLVADVHVRQAARAVPGLADAAAALAADHPAARDLANILAVLDEEAVLVVEPASRTGFRVEVCGVADVNQFYLLLADLIPGRRERSSPGMMSRFQLFALSGLRDNATLIPGLRGADHWLWGDRPASSLPRFEGERVVLLGEPSVPTVLSDERRFFDMPAEARIVRGLSRAEVVSYLSRWTGQTVAEPEPAATAPARAA